MIVVVVYSNKIKIKAGEETLEDLCVMSFESNIDQTSLSLWVGLKYFLNSITPLKSLRKTHNFLIRFREQVTMQRLRCVISREKRWQITEFIFSLFYAFESPVHANSCDVQIALNNWYQTIAETKRGQFIFWRFDKIKQMQPKLIIVVKV